MGRTTIVHKNNKAILMGMALLFSGLKAATGSICALFNFLSRHGFLDGDIHHPLGKRTGGFL